jgi:hypothetical protein
MKNFIQKNPINFKFNIIVESNSILIDKNIVKSINK